MWSSWYHVTSSFHSDSHRFVTSNNTNVFCLVSSHGSAGFPATSGTMKVYKALLLASEFPTFLESFSWCVCILHHLVQVFFNISLNSSCSGSMKEIPRNLLALSSFGSSIAHFCFSSRFDATATCFRIYGRNLSGLEVVCFLVSLPLDHVYPSDGFALKKKWISWNQAAYLTIHVVSVSLVTSMYFSGIENILQAARTIWLGVPRDDGKWNLLW